MAAIHNVLLGSSGGGITSQPFPVAIPNLGVWWDASDAATITQSAGLVSEVLDKSGNGRNLSSSGGLRPTFTAASQNGLSVLTGTGGQSMALAATYALTASATYIFAVVSNADASLGTVFLPGVSSNQYFADLEPSGGGSQINNFGGVLRQQANLGISASNNSPHLLVISITGAGTELWYDDITTTVAGTGSGNITGLANYQNPSFLLDGRVMEVVIGTAALSAQQIADTRAYLKTKWGL